MFGLKKYNKKKLVALAHAAKDYARQQIVLSSNSPENNLITEDQQHYLRIGLYGSKYKESSLGVRDVIQSEREKRIARGEDKNLAYHNSIVAVTSKYSLGNCQELAHQALEYILKNHKNIRAELFRMQNGDHVFVVINRKSKSDPANPLTWGSNAIICDPWMNIIFHASESATKLKSYYYDLLSDRHTLENYDKSKHTLETMIYNTDELRPKKR